MKAISAPLLAALERGGTLVTADPQQAYRIRLAWADHQRASGAASWPTPQALPLSAALSRAWMDALIEGDGARPQLLSLHQERALWAQVVREMGGARGFLQPHGTVSAVMRAWRRTQHWTIDPVAIAQSPVDEVRAFAEWSRAFAARCREHDCIDGASALARAPIPRGPAPWIALGFDAPPTALRALIARFERAGIDARFAEGASLAGTVARVPCADRQAEWRAAAGWARRKLLEDPGRRLMIVIPDLARERERVEHAFDEILRPASLLSSSASSTVPFAIEGGMPLTRYAMVDAALTAIALVSEAQPFDVASGWLRSTYLLGTGVREGDRARLDLELRCEAPHEVDLGTLATAMERAARRRGLRDPLWGACRRFQQALADRHGLAEWSALVSSALRELGWPGVRDRDSAEQQILEKFNATLAELASLDEIVGTVDARGMLAHLRSIAEQTSFQPETGDAPVSVTGRLADPALAVDGLWVTGLDANTWPRAPRPDPFLPWEAQRTAGIPEASAEGMLTFAQRLTQRWSVSAEEVIFSWPQRVDDEACLPSALIGHLPIHADADVTTRARGYWLQVRKSASVERSFDETGPRLPATMRVPGGSHSLRLQSQCALRAFAERRLDAPAFDLPAPGLDAATRGSLVHHALRVLWSEIESQDELRALDVRARDELCGFAVAEASARYLDRSARWPARVVQLERERLHALLQEWLELELERSPFRVLSVEQSTPAELAGHAIELQIDRVDALADGRRLLIDYKTSAITPASWFGDRPEDAQLPVYASVLEPAVDGIAIGRLRVGDVSLQGASSRPSITGGRYDPDDWNAQLASWRETVGRLAREFVSGDARVNPRQPPETCRYCHLHSLCRIDELRIASIDEDEPDE